MFISIANGTETSLIAQIQTPQWWLTNAHQMEWLCQLELQAQLPQLKHSGTARLAYGNVQLIQALLQTPVLTKNPSHKTLIRFLFAKEWPKMGNRLANRMDVYGFYQLLFNQL